MSAIYRNLSDEIEELCERRLEACGADVAKKPARRRDDAWTRPFLDGVDSGSYLATVRQNGQNPCGALQRLMVAESWMPPVAESG